MSNIGEPFIFCGRIVEAYYTNPELNTVSIMWSDGDKNREYHVVVDEEDDQFQALLKEFDYDSLDECTRKRHQIHRDEFTKAFSNYATEHNLYGYGNTDSLKEQEERNVEVRNNMEQRQFASNFDLLFNFDPENNEHKEQLFKLKLRMFEADLVKNSKARTKKTALRTAKTPVEVIGAYSSFTK